jgi:hypothetical protein
VEESGFKNTGSVEEDAMESEVTLVRSSNKIVWSDDLPEKLLTFVVLIGPVVVRVIVFDITRVEVFVSIALMYMLYVEYGSKIISWFIEVVDITPGIP